MKPIVSLLCAFLYILMFASCASSSKVKNDLIDNEKLLSEYALLAQEHSNLGEHEKALELLLEAESLSSKNNELTYMIARTAALAKQWPIAIEQYELLLKQDSENLLLQKSIAWIYAQSGDISTAENMYESLYEKHSYDKDICTNYILVLAANNNQEKALSILTEYASIYPEEANISELREIINSKENSEEHQSSNETNNETSIE